MTTLFSRLEKSWLDTIGGEFGNRYMVDLEGFLRREKDAARKIYPVASEIFDALSLTAFENVKVVIIGQDPYHGEGQANGLCFSVRRDKDIPPSLRNIYDEIGREYNDIKRPSHGDLNGWAEQGVLLLNAVLTVQEGKPRSHRGKGWEQFTDAIIRAVNETREHVVFLLWGSDARKKTALIDGKRHLLLATSHPSPLSSYRGFAKCDHFRKANEYLKKHGLKPIDWRRI